jgi:hypothetical protein
MSECGCRFGCTGDDVAVHHGWFRCTPQSRAMLAEERKTAATLEDRRDTLGGAAR